MGGGSKGRCHSHCSAVRQVMASLKPSLTFSTECIPLFLRADSLLSVQIIEAEIPNTLTDPENKLRVAIQLGWVEKVKGLRSTGC